MLGWNLPLLTYFIFHAYAAHDFKRKVIGVFLIIGKADLQLTCYSQVQVKEN